jgi:hypothetical protein
LKWSSDAGGMNFYHDSQNPHAAIMRQPTAAAACTRNLGSPCNSNTNGMICRMPSGNQARKISAKVNEQRAMNRLNLVFGVGIKSIIYLGALFRRL